MALLNSSSLPTNGSNKPFFASSVTSVQNRSIADNSSSWPGIPPCICCCCCCAISCCWFSASPPSALPPSCFVLAFVLPDKTPGPDVATAAPCFYYVTGREEYWSVFTRTIQINREETRENEREKSRERMRTKERKRKRGSARESK